MMFRWLKRFTPRGLYGRTALILVAPVVVLQLVVSFVFIGRHLSKVTTELAYAELRELAVISDVVDGSMTQGEALARMAPLLHRFGMGARFVEPGAMPDEDFIQWYDFSARVVRDTFRERMPQIAVLEFGGDNMVLAYRETALGVLRLSFSRRRVTVAAPHQLIVTMVAFGVLMTVIAFVYMRNQLRPITRLARAAQAFGRGHHMPYKPSGAVEVRAAGHAFLDMRDRIERQIEQRTMMLSGVSHDLRTPLTRLKLGLSMMEDSEPLLNDVAEMQKLLDAFLDFSRGAVEDEAEPVNPLDLVGQIVADAQRAGMGVGLALAEGDRDATLMLRPSAIRRAVENLISNALRYGNRAEVSVLLTPRQLRIRVEDDGPGIAESDREEAVKPFTRLDPARNQDRGSGVGLGLAIVADVASIHGGRLVLGRSERLGGLLAEIIIAR